MKSKNYILTVLFTILFGIVTIIVVNPFRNRETVSIVENPESNLNVVENNTEIIVPENTEQVEPEVNPNNIYTTDIFKEAKSSHSQGYHVPKEINELLKVKNTENEGVYTNSTISNESLSKYTVDDIFSHEELSNFYNGKHLDFITYDDSRYYTLAIMDESLIDSDYQNAWIMKYTYDKDSRKYIPSDEPVNIYLSKDISYKVKVALTNYSAGNEKHISINDSMNYSIYFIQPSMPTSIPVKINNITNTIYTYEGQDYWAGINLTKLFE